MQPARTDMLAILYGPSIDTREASFSVVVRWLVASGMWRVAGGWWPVAWQVGDLDQRPELSGHPLPATCH